MEPRTPGVPIRVLVADDYAGMHAAVARVLEPACTIVGSVTNGSDLIDEAIRVQPDVIVLDLTMAGGDSFELCSELRAAVVAAKIVLYSADDEPDLRDRALAAGASGFVAKVRIARDLLPAIQRAVS